MSLVKKIKDKKVNFEFNKEFSNKIFPKTIELGRSFVQPAYQPSSGNRKSIFSLDNLWDGLGALVVNYPKVEYFFGKVTMYLDFNKKGRDLILGFINHFFPNKENWINAKYPLKYHHDIGYFVKEIEGLDYETAYKVLLKKLKELENQKQKSQEEIKLKEWEAKFDQQMKLEEEEEIFFMRLVLCCN